MNMKSFDVATQEEFEKQTNGDFLFGKRNIVNGVAILSFIDVFHKIICSIEKDGKEQDLRSPSYWNFAKTPEGFIFAYPKALGDDVIHYDSKMSHASVDTTALIAGYCATLIWLSLISGFSDEHFSQETTEIIIQAHDKGMSYYDLVEYFTENDLSNMYSILD